MLNLISGGGRVASFLSRSTFQPFRRNTGAPASLWKRRHGKIYAPVVGHHKAVGWRCPGDGRIVPAAGLTVACSPKVKNEQPPPPSLPPPRTSPQPRSTASHPSFSAQPGQRERLCPPRERFNRAGVERVRGKKGLAGWLPAGHNSLDSEMQLPACVSWRASARARRFRIAAAVSAANTPSALSLPPFLLTAVPTSLSQWRQWRRRRAGTVAENLSQWRQRRRHECASDPAQQRRLPGLPAGGGLLLQAGGAPLHVPRGVGSLAQSARGRGRSPRFPTRPRLHTTRTSHPRTRTKYRIVLLHSLARPNSLTSAAAAVAPQQWKRALSLLSPLPPSAPLGAERRPARTPTAASEEERAHRRSHICEEEEEEECVRQCECQKCATWCASRTTATDGPHCYYSGEEEPAVDKQELMRVKAAMPTTPDMWTDAATAPQCQV